MSRHGPSRAIYLACGFGLGAQPGIADVVGLAIRDGAVVVDAAGKHCAGCVLRRRVHRYRRGGTALCEGGTPATSALRATTERRDILPRIVTDRGVLPQRSNRAFALREELRTLADDDTLICRCEDVTRKRSAGLPSWRAAKLQTRCGMGPCQGRVCGAAAQFVFGWNIRFGPAAGLPCAWKRWPEPWKEGD